LHAPGLALALHWHFISHGVQTIIVGQDNDQEITLIRRLLTRPSFGDNADIAISYAAKSKLSVSGRDDAVSVPGNRMAALRSPSGTTSASLKH